MRLLAAAALVMLGGLSLLMAMVARVVEPGLGLSLVGYATFFSGMLLGLLGAVRRAGGRG